MKRNIFKKRKYISFAFTLSEVLLTLTIIGIIAALTIPIIISQYTTQKYKAAFKSDFSDLNQAMNSIISSNGGSFYKACGYWVDSCLYQLFSPYFSNAQKCPDAMAGGCWHGLSNWKNKWGVACDQLSTCNLWGKDLSYRPGGMVMPNGSLVFFVMYDGTTCNTSGPICGQILIDANGFTPPNQLGTDILAIEILPNKLTPDLVNNIDNSLSKTYLYNP